MKTRPTQWKWCPNTPTAVTNQIWLWNKISRGKTILQQRQVLLASARPNISISCIEFYILTIPPPGKNTPRYIYFSHNNRLSFLLKVDYINSNGEQINVPHQHKHNYISGPYISITEQYKLLNHRPICFLTSAPLNQHPICTISNAKSESGTMKISGRKQRRYRGPITRKWRVYKWSSTIKKSTRNTNQSKEFQPRSARIKQMHG